MTLPSAFACLAMLATVTAAWGENVRVWKSNQDDDGSVHVLGNGNVCAYEQGPNLIQLFGPPYSSPSVLGISLPDQANRETRSRRLPGTAVWRHEILVGGQSVGGMTDFVDSRANVFVRTTSLKRPVDLTLQPAQSSDLLAVGARFRSVGASSAAYLTVPAGTPVFNYYPTPTARHHLLLTAGAVHLESGGSAGNWTLRCGPGEGVIYIVCGSTYPECVELAERTLVLGPRDALQRTEQSWQTFTRRRRDFAKLLAEKTDGLKTPLARVLETIDDVAVLIKAQQGRDGGVLAGHFYHLGYVRDQYGVSRALLKLGYADEARLILERYWTIWQRRGRINNAHGIDVAGIAHIHENDDVEITGYILIQAFNYLDNTGDADLLREILPLLEWCWDAQKKHLVLDMLPFNGDETYVAGGILPRSALNDGSAEATLLLITGGSRLLDWIEKQSLWPKDRLKQDRALLKRVRERFRKNFWEDGKLLTNNPARAAAEGGSPRFRHGVCEGDSSWGWSERSQDGRYCCPRCVASGKPLPAAEPTKHHLVSVSMVPLYLGATLLSADDLRPMIDELVEQLRRTGQLPSTPGGNRTVGHEYGLLLYSMTETGHPHADLVFDALMSRLDATGAWVEYYIDNVPQGCRCRPWESAINLEALIHYLEQRP